MATAGVEFDTKKPTDRNGIEPTQVKSIKLLTALDNGSKNDGTGKGVQPGMLYGKTYSFKVSAYTNGKPNDLKKIKWKFKYHSLSKDKWIIINSTVTGDSYSIVMNEKDMCGRTIHVMAYINDCENEGYLKTWFHNRFRWFDRELVQKQAEDRAKDPWKIDQHSSSLCGMAALYYILIKKSGKLYLKIAKDLLRTGESVVGNFTIKPHDQALIMYDMDPKSSSYATVNMPFADWIVLATTRSREAFLYDNLVYKGVEKGNMDMIKAVNWPDMMKKMTTSIAGFNNVKIVGLSNFLIQQKKRPIGGRVYDKFSDSDLEHLLNMEKKHLGGSKIMMMIDSNMIENVTSYSYSDVFNNSHWVVYEGGLSFLDSENKKTSDLSKAENLTFKIYTWGYNPNNSYLNEEGKYPAKKYKLLQSDYKISTKCFKSSFYGYIEAY